MKKLIATGALLFVLLFGGAEAYAQRIDVNVQFGQDRYQRDRRYRRAYSRYVTRYTQYYGRLYKEVYLVKYLPNGRTHYRLVSRTRVYRGY